MLDRIRTWLERRRYGTSDRVAGWNYDRRLLAVPRTTPGGRIRTYELYNRHGRQAMLRALCARCGPDDVVYDVGASVGVYALAVAAGSPDRRVVAYEPAPPTVERLQANCERNDCGDRVTIRPVGLGATDGTRRFYVSTYPELSSFDRESATRWGASVAATEPVPVRRLDDETRDRPAPDVLKIDVEGAGAAVLRGARETLRTHRPAVFLEVHREGLPGDRTAAIREELAAADYVIDEDDRFWRADPRA
ncbi:FkbM family methyltransferase [Halopenitus persicus]|uniref:FkbM family methyltransferase n=1 Tax=Halopenitus persicus TaxID=1048396 RepID=UPI001E3790A1|nr:FkbM family methyltransferase [Halopenitus persicus]